MYVGLCVNMSLLSICTKVYFALRILVNSPKNSTKPRLVDAVLFYTDRTYVPFAISLLKCVRIAIRIKLQKQYNNWVVRGIYDLYGRSDCEVYFLRRRPCFFIALTIGIYEGIGTVILLSIFYGCTTYKQ